MKLAEKQKAIQLRNAGMSMKDISRELAVSKSSVSLWVRGVVLSDKQQKRLAKKGFKREAIEKRRQSRLLNEQNKREVFIESGRGEIDSISRKDLKIIGTMLYWAEGAKTNRGMVRFTNSNPHIIKVMMEFFRKECAVPEEKFRGHIHTHSHLNAKRAEEYWSHATGIPLRQFFKTYSKPSVASKNKKDSLPYGTLEVCICDTKLFLRIQGLTEKIANLVIGL